MIKPAAWNARPTRYTAWVQADESTLAAQIDAYDDVGIGVRPCTHTRMVQIDLAAEPCVSSFAETTSSCKRPSGLGALVQR